MRPYNEQRRWGGGGGGTTTCALAAKTVETNGSSIYLLANRREIGRVYLYFNDPRTPRGTGRGR